MKKILRNKPFFFNCILKLFIAPCFTFCTYSVTMVHTEGQATDVVDETATNTPTTTATIPVNVTPNLPIPATLTPRNPE
jgi:hypothetical protein